MTVNQKKRGHLRTVRSYGASDLPKMIVNTYIVFLAPCPVRAGKKNRMTAVRNCHSYLGLEMKTCKSHKRSKTKQNITKHFFAHSLPVELETAVSKVGPMQQ